MTLYDRLEPGIWFDDDSGDIWRRKDWKSNWTVNGQDWVPFPKNMSMLSVIVDGPAVTIEDAVHEEEEGRWTWRVIPTHPHYEANVIGDVRYRDNKKSIGFADFNGDSYWLVDIDGEGSWVSRTTIKQTTYPYTHNP